MLIAPPASASACGVCIHPPRLKHCSTACSGDACAVLPTAVPALLPCAALQYTPADGGPQHASGAASRIIKMQDMPVDPLEPPKFRHIKVCGGGPGGAVPG